MAHGDKKHAIVYLPDGASVAKHLVFDDKESADKAFQLFSGAHLQAKTDGIPAALLIDGDVVTGDPKRVMLSEFDTDEIMSDASDDKKARDDAAAKAEQDAKDRAAKAEEESNVLGDDDGEGEGNPNGNNPPQMNQG